MERSRPIFILVTADEDDATSKWLKAVPSDRKEAMPLAGGWLLLEADVLPEHDDLLPERLRTTAAAILVHGGPADVVRIVLFERDHDPIELMAGYPLDDMGGVRRAERDPSLIEWSTRHAPKPFTSRAAVGFWNRMLGASGSEIAHALIDRMGWRRARLGGLPPSIREHTGEDRTALVGETRVDWERVRWLVGLEDDFWGLWDRENPTMKPIQTWPLTADGRLAAREAQRRLVDIPVLEATRLTGQRAWARVDPRWGAPALLVHLASQGYASVFVTSDPPRTLTVTEVGSARISPQEADAVGWPMSSAPPSVVELPLTGMEDAQRMAAALVFGAVTGPLAGGAGTCAEGPARNDRVGEPPRQLGRSQPSPRAGCRLPSK